MCKIFLLNINVAQLPPVSPGGVVRVSSVTSARDIPIQTQPASDPRQRPGRGTLKRFYHVYRERRGSHTALAGACKWQGVPQIRGLLISKFRFRFRFR